MKSILKPNNSIQSEAKEKFYNPLNSRINLQVFLEPKQTILKPNNSIQSEAKEKFYNPLNSRINLQVFLEPKQTTYKDVLQWSAVVKGVKNPNNNTKQGSNKLKYYNFIPSRYRKAKSMNDHNIKPKSYFISR